MAAKSLKVELSALSNSVTMRLAISFPSPECAAQASGLASEKNVLVVAGLGAKERQLTILRLLCQNSNSRMQCRSKSNKESHECEQAIDIWQWRVIIRVKLPITGPIDIIIPTAEANFREDVLGGRSSSEGPCQPFQ